MPFEAAYHRWMRSPSPCTVATRTSPASRAATGVLVGVTTLIVLTAASCSASPSDIVLGAAGRADVTEVVDASASVTAKAVAVLSSPADGTLAALNVSPGQSVVVGQVLAVVDSPSAQQRLRQAG